MTTEFKTEIVKSKEFNKLFIIAVGIVNLISLFYIYLYDKENQNVFFTYLAFSIFTLGTYFLFSKSFIKPKNIGYFNISNERIEFNKDGFKKSILQEELENINLKYLHYGSWKAKSKFGNKNYITITEKSGDKYDFEILIRNINSKNDLRKVLNSPEFKDKFELIKAGNSRTDF